MLYVDGRIIGSTLPGGYFRIDVLPGKRVLHGDGPDLGRIEVEARVAEITFVSLNVAGVAKPFLTLERPVIPGQQLLSGFVVSPALSARAMLMHSGRTHLAHGISAMLDGELQDPLAVPVTSAGRLQDEPLVCVPPKPHLWWLRRGAAAAVNVALAALIF